MLQGEKRFFADVRWAPLCKGKYPAGLLLNQSRSPIFTTNPLAVLLKSIPCSGPPGPAQAVVRWPHRVQGETLVGVHRIETVGLFASFWSQKEGHPGRLPSAKKQRLSPPLRGTAPCTGEAFGAVPVLRFPPAAYPVSARIFPPGRAARRVHAQRTAISGQNPPFFTPT